MTLDDKPYRVIDLIERVENRAAPRGFQRIIVFRPDMTPAYQLPYFPPAKPVGCHGANLEFSAPVEINNTLPEGRTVSFANGAEDATVLPGR